MRTQATNGYGGLAARHTLHNMKGMERDDMAYAAQFQPEFK